MRKLLGLLSFCVFFISPCYLYAGGFTGGGGGGVALGASPTWTGDHTFNGGGGAISFGADETIVPADGELTVTGKGASSGGAAVGGATIFADYYSVPEAGGFTGSAGNQTMEPTASAGWVFNVATDGLEVNGHW